MRNIILFDETATRENLLPITFTRPVFSRKDLPPPLEEVAAQMVEDMVRADRDGAGGGNEGTYQFR